MKKPEEIDNQINKSDEEVEVTVERTVPVTDTEILGLSSKKEKADDGFILEFGFMKDDKNEVIVIDTRKYLSNKMARDLYKKLKSIFETDKQDI